MHAGIRAARRGGVSRFAGAGMSLPIGPDVQPKQVVF